MRSVKIVQNDVICTQNSRWGVYCTCFYRYRICWKIGTSDHLGGGKISAKKKISANIIWGKIYEKGEEKNEENVKEKEERQNIKGK